MSASTLAPAASQAIEAPISVFGSSLQLTARPFPGLVRIPVYLDVSNKEVVFDPHTHPQLAPMLSLFESVHLVEFELTISVQPGIVNAMALAVRSGADTEYMPYIAYPYVTYVYGAQYGTTEQLWRLPEPNPFGTEIKAIALGNSAPVFHFSMASATGGSPGHAQCRGHMLLRCSGVGVVNGMDLNKANTGPFPQPPKALAVHRGLLDPHNSPPGTLDEEGDVVPLPTPAATPAKSKST